MFALTLNIAPINHFNKYIICSLQTNLLQNAYLLYAEKYRLWQIKSGIVLRNSEDGISHLEPLILSTSSTVLCLQHNWTQRCVIPDVRNGFSCWVQLSVSLICFTEDRGWCYFLNIGFNFIVSTGRGTKPKLWKIPSH